jgi:hypothetical protein
MSVSFYPAIEENVAHIITCICEETNFNTVYATRTEAYEAKKNPLLKSNCGDIYCDYLYVKPAVFEPEVNMSNSNANDLLDVLGLAVGEDFSDYCAGSITAEGFLGRVLLAKGVAPVSPARLPEKDGIMVYGGRAEGYVQEKLEQLQEVADWAIANKREIIWS